MVTPTGKPEIQAHEQIVIPAEVAAQYPQGALKEELNKEQDLVAQLMTNKQWEGLTQASLPLLFQISGRAINFHRLDMITDEMTEISNRMVPAIMSNKEMIATLRGRMQELSIAAADTITQLYPNTKKVFDDEHVPVTPESLADIDAYVKEGAVDQLNETNIPGWDGLSADQRLLYRLDALQVYVDRWQEVGEAEEFNEDEPIGFTHSEKDARSSTAKRISGTVKEKIIQRYLTAWLDEAKELGLDDTHPVVQKTKELIASAS